MGAIYIELFIQMQTFNAAGDKLVNWLSQDFRVRNIPEILGVS
jgi:hypothetical protein